MADKTTNSQTLKFVSNYNDGDTRLISIDNPVSTELLPAKLRQLESILQETKGFIGDKNAGTFTHLSEAKIVTTTETKFDLG